MAIETFERLSAAGQFSSPFKINPESGFNFISQGARTLSLMPSNLLDQWKAWKESYPKLVARNPRLELYDVMHSISESNDRSSWPAGLERRIQAWVNADDSTVPPPFDDRDSIVTPEFYRRLRELRRLCGGWLYWSDKDRGVVFAPEPDWQKVCAEQEAAEAKRRREWEERRARVEQMARRLDEAVATARADHEFWNALKDWELAREAKRPADVPKSEARRFGGPIRMQKATQPPTGTLISNSPVDQIFAKFIARVGVKDDPWATFVVVFNLRGAIRNELGLDDVLGWKGGPSFGESG
jgi:hypothetical protein